MVLAHTSSSGPGKPAAQLMLRSFFGHFSMSINPVDDIFKVKAGACCRYVFFKEVRRDCAELAYLFC